MEKGYIEMPDDEDDDIISFPSIDLSDCERLSLSSLLQPDDDILSFGESTAYTNNNPPYDKDNVLANANLSGPGTHQEQYTEQLLDQEHATCIESQHDQCLISENSDLQKMEKGYRDMPDDEIDDIISFPSIDLSDCERLSLSSLLQPDDDILSFGESTAYTNNNPPFDKDNVLTNANLSGPSTHQEQHREQLLDQEHATCIESQHDQCLISENSDLQKKRDAMNLNVEQSKLDSEQKIRNLECKYSEEMDMKIEETLLDKTKEQLARKEEQNMGMEMGYIIEMPDDDVSFRSRDPQDACDIPSITSFDLRNDDVWSDTGNAANNNSCDNDVHVLANMILSDTILKLQEQLGEERILLKQERDCRANIESQRKSLVKENKDLQKKIDALNFTRQTLEQSKLDSEQKIRNLEYKYSDEMDMRKNAETLFNKIKEQLARKEEQYIGEMEAKQKLEFQIRNLQMEIQSANNVVKQLQDEKESLTRQYQHEKSLQEQLIEEQKLQQRLHDDQIKSVTQKLQDEKESLTRQYQHEKSLQEQLIEEQQKLQQRLHDDQIKSVTQKLQDEKESLTRQYQHEKSLQEQLIEEQKLQQRLHDDQIKSVTQKLQDEKESLTRQYQHEKSLQEQLIEEQKLQQRLHDDQIKSVTQKLNSTRNRLQAASSEIEKYAQARNDLERRYLDEKEDWIRKVDIKEQEVSSMKEKTQGLHQKLHATKTKLNSVENELHISNTSLLERSNMLQEAQQEAEFYKSVQNSYDENYKGEKELNLKLQVKVKALQEKNIGLQHDNLNLKKQLKTAQQTVAQKKSGDHEKFTTMLATLTTEHQKSKLALEERNLSLSDAVGRLREEIQSSEGRRNQTEEELSRMNKECNELLRKVSVAEASPTMANKAKESLEEERGRLKLEVEKFQQKYEMAQKMVDRQVGSKQNNMFNNQQLFNSFTNMTALSRSKVELKERYQKLQIDNARLQAELTHEKWRAERLHKDLQDSLAERQKTRNLNMGNMTAGFSSAYSSNTLGNRVNTELDHSISQHLEAAPHDNIRPLIRSGDGPLPSSMFIRSNADYLDLLQNRYCI